jgi:hypothetical protein
MTIVALLAGMVSFTGPQPRRARQGSHCRKAKGARGRSKEIALSNNSIKQRANAQFRKPADLGTGKSAASEYETAASDLAAKIARLKELRLARDAAILAAPKPVKAKKGAKKKKSAPVSPAESLSDWLKSRQVGGHNN